MITSIFSFFIKGKGSFKASEKHITQFTSHFSSLLMARVSIVEALRLITGSELDKPVSKIAKVLLTKLEDGVSISNAVQSCPHCFNYLYCQLVMTGEASGNLGGLMSHLADYRARSAEIRVKLQRACIYPFLLLVFAFAMMVGLLTMVVPRFKDMFANAESRLPLLTRGVVAVSDSLVTNWQVMFLFVMSITVTFALLWKVKAVKHWFNAICLRVPFIGGLILCRQREVFLRSLGLLVGAKIPVHEAIVKLMEHHKGAFLSRLPLVEQALRKGETLEKAMEKSTLFSPADLLAARLGQSGARLDALMLQQAEQYADKVQRSLQYVIVLLEPALMLGIGLFIGAIVVAIYLPLFSLGQVL